jgi:hypothetical protein
VHDKLRAAVTFWDGVRTSFGIVLIGGLDAQPDVDHTVIALLDGSRRQVWTLDWKARLILGSGDPLGPALAIGLDGQVCAVTRTGLQEQGGVDVGARGNKFGRLLGGCKLPNGHLTVGYSNQVYFRDALSKVWVAMDEGLPGKEAYSERVFGLESIDASPSGDWYAVGPHGAVWLREGTHWQKIESCTDVRLVAVHCAEDGFVYACGQHGTLLKGKLDAWEVVQQDIGQVYLWDVESMGKDLYIASSRVLYKVSDGGWSPVMFTEFDLGERGVPTSFFRLSKSASSLLSVGEKDVVEMVDGQWSRIV